MDTKDALGALDVEGEGVTETEREGVPLSLAQLEGLTDTDGHAVAEGEPE